MSFRAVLTSRGQGAFVVARCRSRAAEYGQARPPVRGTVNGHPFRTTVAVSTTASRTSAPARRARGGGDRRSARRGDRASSADARRAARGRGPRRPLGRAPRRPRRPALVGPALARTAASTSRRSRTRSADETRPATNAALTMPRSRESNAARSDRSRRHPARRRPASTRTRSGRTRSSSPRAGWTACSRSARPGRGSSSRDERRRAAELFLAGPLPVMVRPPRRPVDGGHGRARRARCGGRGRGGRRDRPAVLPARRARAARALRGGGRRLRAAAVLRLRVRARERLRGAGAVRRAARAGAEPRGAEGLGRAVREFCRTCSRVSTSSSGRVAPLRRARRGRGGRRVRARGRVPEVSPRPCGPATPARAPGSSAPRSSASPARRAEADPRRAAADRRTCARPCGSSDGEREELQEWLASS